MGPWDGPPCSKASLHRSTMPTSQGCQFPHLLHLPSQESFSALPTPAWPTAARVIF